MRDELLPAKDVAAYWVEHVLRHGGTKHLQSKVKDMPWYKVYLLDVILFLITVLALPPILLIVLLTGKFRKPSREKTKTH